MTHANEAIANTWNFLKSYLVSSESVWKVFWSNVVLGRYRFFLWENKPFGSYYVSYGLTLSLVKKFQKGFLINLDNCCSCASHRKIIWREILPRQYDLLIFFLNEELKRVIMFHFGKTFTNYLLLIYLKLNIYCWNKRNKIYGKCAYYLKPLGLEYEFLSILSENNKIFF